MIQPELVAEEETVILNASPNCERYPGEVRNFKPRGSRSGRGSVLRALECAEEYHPWLYARVIQ
jgi:hypothetical protein